MVEVVVEVEVVVASCRRLAPPSAHTWNWDTSHNRLKIGLGGFWIGLLRIINAAFLFGFGFVLGGVVTTPIGLIVVVSSVFVSMERGDDDDDDGDGDTRNGLSNRNRLVSFVAAAADDDGFSIPARAVVVVVVGMAAFIRVDVVEYLLICCRRRDDSIVGI